MVSSRTTARQNRINMIIDIILICVTILGKLSKAEIERIDLQLLKDLKKELEEYLAHVGACPNA